ncbi:MAG: hypothetical protein AAB633_03070 [Patescibacteria group bacterium]
MSRKKVVVPRPFHEVAFDVLEQGEKSEAYRKLNEWIGSAGQDAAVTVAFLLTRCIVPEKEQPRVVPALIAAAQKLGECDDGEVNKAVAFALTHFMPGKKGLKQIQKELNKAYLATEEDSDEEDNLKDLFKHLELSVPERPEEEAAAPEKKVAKKPASPKGKAKAKGGGKKPAVKKAPKKSPKLTK